MGAQVDGERFWPVCLSPSPCCAFGGKRLHKIELVNKNQQPWRMVTAPMSIKLSFRLAMISIKRLYWDWARGMWKGVCAHVLQRFIWSSSIFYLVTIKKFYWRWRIFVKRRVLMDSGLKWPPQAFQFDGVLFINTKYATEMGFAYGKFDSVLSLIYIYCWL